MHDLEHSIVEWRKTMLATPEVSRETLDELENHLRENVEQLVRSGMTEREAFQQAARELGGATALSAEFKKLERGTWLPVKVITAVGILVVLGGAIVLVANLDAPPVRLLLATHTFAVTIGYGTTLLLGALGICFVAQRCISDLPLPRMRSLTRVTFVFGCVAAGLTMLGIVLGAVWAKAEWGRYWAWDVKEVGACAVIVWQLGFLLAHRVLRKTGRGILVMTILGNIIVGWAWFGTNRLAGSPPSGTPDWPLLLTAAFLNLALFLVGLAPAGWLRLRRAS